MKEAGIVDALRAAPLEREDLPVLRQALRAAALPDGDLDADNVNLYAFQQGDGSLATAAWRLTATMRAALDRRGS